MVSFSGLKTLLQFRAVSEYYLLTFNVRESFCVCSDLIKNKAYVRKVSL